MRWRARAWKIAFFVALLAVTWLLLTPRPPGPDLFEGADKLVHLALFAGLGVLALRAYADRPRWGIFVALVVYGGCIEVAQLRTGRAAEWLDLAADVVGASIVWLAPRRRG